MAQLLYKKSLMHKLHLNSDIWDVQMRKIVVSGLEFVVVNKKLHHQFYSEQN